MKDFETSKKEIEKLVNKFKKDEDYIIKNFDEENTKQKFINKFFIALGWDVDMELDVAPQYADVEFEDSIRINGKNKAPDYCFKVGPEKVFFVEAKAPHENIEKNKSHAYQLKKYTWSAKLPLGILTDFQEFAVYEPTDSPKEHHTASRQRIKYYKYTDYVENWEEIFNIFSKEAVWNGNFDKFVEGRIGNKKGTATVDDEFLDTIEKWRLELAKIIARKNEGLTIEELNYAVQLIIDRIIFLRIAEDRGIEKYEQLKNLIELAKNNEDSECPIYEEFIKLCKKADEKYNSGLFHFKEEKDISLSRDDLTPKLIVSDKVLKEIILGLYPPNCSYEFSVISTEILGNIYEQFLGNVIYFTPTKQAKVKQKPEVKKAGGVYYTPQFIVKYIVENTVGELLKGKTPNKVSEMRFVDPACGSGSFLLGAYQKLLDWHLDYYSNLEQPPSSAFYIGKGGIPHLTIQEKKRILLNNIYGVDIDAQAVEVTKLSLLLKVLEGENKDIFESQQKLIQERALPYLGDNIRCGNSLVDEDILNSDITFEEIEKIKPFNWKKSFPKVFADGGFDAVIGNPPYVGEKGNKETFRDIKKTEWGKKYYYTKMDLFYYFYHRALDLCNDNGKVSFITTSYFLTADGAIKLRNDLKLRSSVNKILNFNELQVFKNAKGQHNTILILSKSKNNKKCEVYNSDLSGSLSNRLFKEIFNQKNIFKKISQNQLFEGEENLIFLEGLSSDNDDSKDDKINTILNKIKGDNPLLKDIMSVNAGADVTISKITQKHIDNFGSKFKKGEGVFVLTEKEFKNKHFPNEELTLIKPFIKNSDISKYYIKDSTKYLIYTNSETNINQFPMVKQHLSKFRVILKDQMKRYDEPITNWFMLHRPRNENIFISEKIVLPYRSKINSFAYSDSPIYASRDVFFLLKNENDFNIKYILALLNSKLFYLWLYYRGKRKGETLELYATPVGNIPLKFISVEKQKDFVDLADKLILLNNEFESCKVPSKKDLFELQIDDAYNKIDQLVYKLYNLTDEEIQIVEEIVGDYS